MTELILVTKVTHHVEQSRSCFIDFGRNNVGLELLRPTFFHEASFPSCDWPLKVLLPEPVHDSVYIDLHLLTRSRNYR